MPSSMQAADDGARERAEELPHGKKEKVDEF
jgi:hypothetical protein